MRVTLQDVAKEAGVSRATASLVLRGSTTVADDTRQRVLDAMRKLGYVRHRAAASLRTQRTHTVGLVITDITNPFFAELTMGCESELDQANHVVLLGNTGEDLEKQDRLLTVMHEYSVDGVLFCPAEATSPATIERLWRWQLPFVLIVRYLFDIEVDYVGADNIRGAELAVEHLIAHGHRRIAFIGGMPNSSARRDRLEGYRNALIRHNLAVDETLLVSGPPTRDGGYHSIRAVLAQIDRPTAVLCYNDVVAFGVMLGLQVVGLTPGQDMAVIGFDDIAEAALWHPPLTTVSILPRHIGVEAARLLLERIAYPDEKPCQVVLPPTLIVRETCGRH